jgi:hypothetical protein
MRALISAALRSNSSVMRESLCAATPSAAI